MQSVICKRNEGYKWYIKDNCWFKGYLQKQDKDIMRGYEAIALIDSLNSYEELLSLLKQYSGLFSIIVKKEKETWLATDIARSMPIYYTTDLTFISDDIESLKSICERSCFELDDIRVLELYTTSFVGFKNTIYKGVKQLELGCAAKMKDGTITEIPYFIHSSGIKELNLEDAIKDFRNLTTNMIKRMVSVVGDRQIVLSLSGGYDSRYLACSLKDQGINNVICYTYGRSDSFEVAQSKKVADSLGYQWFNIHYDDNSIKQLLVNDKEYLNYCNRPDYSAYLQNYLAVKALHNKGLIPNNSVFITGLCNDMPTGFYIPSEEYVKAHYTFNNEGVAKYNLDKRFVKFNISSEARNVLKNDVLMYLKRMNFKVTDYNSFVGALDCLETANFHSHCYLNMNVAHEYFGHEWLLPCWDKDLLLFWYSLPVNMRIGQKLYAKYITEYLAKKYGVGTKKHLNVLASSPLKAKIIRKAGGVLVKILYPLGIPIHRKTDINNFSILEVELYKNITQKKAVKAERAALILLLTIYMMEKRYGKTWYSSIKKFLIN